MAEAKKEFKKQMTPLAFRQIDVSKAAVKSRLDAFQAARNAPSFHAGEVMKLAFISFAADAVGLEKGTKERADFVTLLDSTPGWFGCGNNSACRQAFEAKNGVAEAAKDYMDV